MAPVTITGHQAVRQALRDVATWSSDLQGDADVRDYRQIPLEVDPPDHHRYRTALSPYFVRPRIDGLVPHFERHAHEILGSFEAAGGGDVVSSVALPYVVRCLGDIYCRPQDVDEWMSWGPDVWQAEGEGRSGTCLHEYLDRVFAEDLGSDDYWSFLRALRIDDRPLTREQFVGIGSVSLAGGRDTVVKLISGAIWHLIVHPADRVRLQDGEVTVRQAIQELLRYLSPLPAMSRVPPDQQPLPDQERDPDAFTRISFVSANYDDEVFPDPEVVQLGRPRIPHLAFGFGPHTCIGNSIAEIETEVILSAALPSLERWESAAEPVVAWATVGGHRFPERIEELQIRIGG
ncbi:MAG: cytochrome P450 [Actinomycetales bacterium]|nr:cytochrome P450 [Actinomycetales bacterium]